MTVLVTKPWCFTPVHTHSHPITPFNEHGNPGVVSRIIKYKQYRQYLLVHHLWHTTIAVEAPRLTIAASRTSKSDRGIEPSYVGAAHPEEFPVSSSGASRVDNHKLSSSSAPDLGHGKRVDR